MRALDRGVVLPTVRIYSPKKIAAIVLTLDFRFASNSLNSRNHSHSRATPPRSGDTAEFLHVESKRNRLGMAQ
jgi:hypothetical protein